MTTYNMMSFFYKLNHLKKTENHFYSVNGLYSSGTYFE